MAATRIVQNILRRPMTGDLITGKQVSIQANCPLFVNGGTEEIERNSYPVTDPVTALWQARLVVNSDPDVLPANSTFTVRELPGVIWRFAVPAGDPDVPVWLMSCLVASPTNPTPIVAPTAADLLAAMFANVVTA